jgi:hypothetical protein
MQKIMGDPILLDLTKSTKTSNTYVKISDIKVAFHPRFLNGKSPKKARA